MVKEQLLSVLSFAYFHFRVEWKAGFKVHILTDFLMCCLAGWFIKLLNVWHTQQQFKTLNSIFTCYLKNCRQEERSTPDHEEEEEEEEENGEESQDGPLLVPRVKVAEDGSIILDEERWQILCLTHGQYCIAAQFVNRELLWIGMSMSVFTFESWATPT